MKTSDLLILGSITACIFAFGKKANAVSVGSFGYNPQLKIRKTTVDELLEQRHKLDKKYNKFKVVAIVETLYTNFEVREKSYNNIMPALSAILNVASTESLKKGLSLKYGYASIYASKNENDRPDVFEVQIG